jgi:hypothetical protein
MVTVWVCGVEVLAARPAGCAIKRWPERVKEPVFGDARYRIVAVPAPAPGETVNHEESEVAVHEQPDPVERMTEPFEGAAGMDAAFKDNESTQAPA